MTLELSVEMVSNWIFTDEDIAVALIELDLIDEEIYQSSLVCEGNPFPCQK